MDENDNPFRVLGVSPDASDDEIARAYKALMYHWHPDRNRRPEAAERSRQLTWAIAELKHSDRRRVHATRYENAPPPPTPPVASSGPPPAAAPADPPWTPPPGSYRRGAPADDDGFKDAKYAWADPFAPPVTTTTSPVQHLWRRAVRWLVFKPWLLIRRRDLTGAAYSLYGRSTMVAVIALLFPRTFLNPLLIIVAQLVSFGGAFCIGVRLLQRRFFRSVHVFRSAAAEGSLLQLGCVIAIAQPVALLAYMLATYA